MKRFYLGIALVLLGLAGGTLAIEVFHWDATFANQLVIVILASAMAYGGWLLAMIAGISEFTKDKVSREEDKG